MTRVHTSPAGTLTMYRDDGSVVGEFGYADLTMTVEDEIHGGGEPVEVEIRKDGGDIAFVHLPEAVRFKPGGLSCVREAHARDQPLSRAERRRLEREMRRSR